MTRRKTITTNYFENYKELLKWLEDLEKAYPVKEGYSINITNDRIGYFVEVLSY